MKYFSALLLLFLLVSPAQADPNKTISYLMSEPMSMFDWGMYRLSRGVIGNYYANNEHVSNAGSLSVDYDWDKNIIVMHHTIYQKTESLKKISSRDLCKELIKSFKFWHKAPTQSLGKFFVHKDFRSKSEPANLVRDVESLIVISISIWASETGEPPFKEICKGSSPLLSNEISIIDYE